MNDSGGKTDDVMSPHEGNASRGDTADAMDAARMREEFERCCAQRQEYLEGWQRARADFINYKNEEGKRIEDMARFITSGLIQELLPVFDSFDLALDHGMDGEKERGVLLIRSQFEDVARKRGLERIRVEAGEAFNPERHESIGEVNSGHAAGTIAEIVQQGYMFRGRVLRPARVRLSKGRNDN